MFSTKKLSGEEKKRKKEVVGSRDVLLYLICSSVKAVRQELQLSDSTDLRGHLDHSHQLLAVQTPQMD